LFQALCYGPYSSPYFKPFVQALVLSPCFKPLFQALISSPCFKPLFQAFELFLEICMRFFEQGLRPSAKIQGTYLFASAGRMVNPLGSCLGAGTINHIVIMQLLCHFALGDGLESASLV
jgi:hypothetical protein